MFSDLNHLAVLSSKSKPLKHPNQHRPPLKKSKKPENRRLSVSDNEI
jgi:hypothetical protein